MTTGQQISLFVKEVTARIKGDEATVVAAKNARKANSAFDAQLALLKSKQVDQENAVEDAKEALNSAQFPTSLVKDNNSYIQGIVNAQSLLDSAEDSLASIKKAIEYFSAKSSELFDVVSAE